MKIGQDWSNACVHGVHGGCPLCRPGRNTAPRRGTPDALGLVSLSFLCVVVPFAVGVEIATSAPYPWLRAGGCLALAVYAFGLGVACERDMSKRNG